MEKKYPIGLEEEANALYQQYCTENNLVYHLTDAAIFCLGYTKAPTGAGWVKATMRLPGWNQPVRWRIGDGPQTKEKIPVCEISKGVDIAAKWEWLDESAPPAIDPDELWDEFSEVIDDDIDSLTRWAGSVVIDREGWRKVMEKLKQSNW